MALACSRAQAGGRPASQRSSAGDAAGKGGVAGPGATITPVATPATSAASLALDHRIGQPPDRATSGAAPRSAHSCVRPQGSSEARRVDNAIRPRMQQMRQRFLEGDEGPNPGPGRRRRRIAAGLFEPRLAAAKQGQLPARLQHRRQGGQQQIHPLLPRQPADRQAKNSGASACTAEAEAPLQRPFVLPLAVAVIGRREVNAPAAADLASRVPQRGYPAR